MELIHFQGLNCFHDCVISIANVYGVSYPAAFSTLWSETDFRYDPYREAYLSKRIITNLDALGVKVSCADCFSPDEVLGHLSQFHAGELLIIGVDAFHIPWSQFYQAFHGPHYIIIQNAEAETLLCFDPTYGKKNERLAYSEVLLHTFDICRVCQTAKTSLETKIVSEAREILRTHPDTLQSLCARIDDAAAGERERIALLAKYIDTMICNRYLFRFFLKNRPPVFQKNEPHPFLSDDHFLQWKAVKNGLYKAAVSKNNERVISDVRAHLHNIMHAEMSLAGSIVAASSSLD